MRQITLFILTLMWTSVLFGQAELRLDVILNAMGTRPNIIDGSGFNGNLPTSVDTIQELADEVDNLSTGSGTFGETSLSTLANNQTLWDSASASRTLTFGLSGASDPVITLSNGVFNLSTGAMQVGGVAVSLSGHTHTGSTISGIDISDDTNLTGNSEIVLTNDSLSIASTLTRDTELTSNLDAVGTRASVITASGFDGNLATTDDTLQEIAQKVDDLVFSGSFGETSLSTLANNQILWDSASASRTLTFGLSGATDPVFTISDGVVNLSTGALQVGGVATSLAGHTHVAADITDVIDISDQTNLDGDAEIVLTNDTLSIDGSITRDTEWDTAAEINAATTDEDFLTDSDIGVTVQAYDADLTTYAGITPSANVQSLLGAANYAAMRTLLDLEAGTDFYSISAADAAFQPLDADLTALAALSGTDNIYYRSAANTWTSITVGTGLTWTGGTLSATGASFDFDALVEGTEADFGATDYMAFSDAGTEKKISGANLQDWIESLSLVFSSLNVTTFQIGGVAVTSTAAELNVLDGIPAGLTATELGYLDGVTSSIATGKQNSDADLTSIAAIATTDVIPYRSAADTWGTVTIGGGLSFSSGTLSATGGIDTTAVDAATWSDGANASNAWTFNISGTTDPVITFGDGVVNVSTGTLQQAGSPVVLDSDIGSTVQAYDADLTTYAGITPSANVQSLLGAATYAAMRTLLDLEPGIDFYSKSQSDATFQPLDSDLTTFAATGILTYEAGGLEADISLYGDSLIGILSGVTTEIDTEAELETAIGTTLATEADIANQVTASSVFSAADYVLTSAGSARQAQASVVQIDGSGNISNVAELSTNSLIYNEKAAHGTPAATKGEFWVKNSTPNKPYFTDDEGTDYDLTTAASAATLTTARTIGGSSFDGSANVTSFPSPGAIGGTTPDAGTFTNLTSTASSVLFSSATPSTTGTAGKIALDTTITGLQGLWQYNDGSTDMSIVAFPTSALTPENGEVLSYNSGSSTFEWINVDTVLKFDPPAHYVDGTNCTVGTTSTSITYGRPTFADGIAAASNWAKVVTTIPDDIQTSNLQVRVKEITGAADSGSKNYVVGHSIVADDSVVASATIANAVDVLITGATGSSAGEANTSAWTTLTGWSTALSGNAGKTWVIWLERDSNDATNDTSTQTSTVLELEIKYQSVAQ